MVKTRVQETEFGCITRSSVFCFWSNMLECMLTPSNGRYITIANALLRCSRNPRDGQLTAASVLSETEVTGPSSWADTVSFWHWNRQCFFLTCIHLILAFIFCSQDVPSWANQNVAIHHHGFWLLRSWLWYYWMLIYWFHLQIPVEFECLNFSSWRDGLKDECGWLYLAFLSLLWYSSLVWTWPSKSSYLSFWCS